MEPGFYRCDECGVKIEPLVVIGENIDLPLSLCAGCLRKGLALVEDRTDAAVSPRSA